MVCIKEFQRIGSIFYRTGLPIPLPIDETSDMDSLSRPIDVAIGIEMNQIVIRRGASAPTVGIDIYRRNGEIWFIGPAQAETDLVLRLRGRRSLPPRYTYLALSVRMAYKVRNRIVPFTIYLDSHTLLWAARIGIHHEKANLAIRHSLTYSLQGRRTNALHQRLHRICQFGRRLGHKLYRVVTRGRSCPEHGIAESLDGVVRRENVFLAIDEHRLHISGPKPPDVLFARIHMSRTVPLEHRVRETRQSILQDGLSSIFWVFLNALFEPFATLERRQIAHRTQSQIYLGTQGEVGIFVTNLQEVLHC